MNARSNSKVYEFLPRRVQENCRLNALVLSLYLIFCESVPGPFLSLSDREGRSVLLHDVDVGVLGDLFGHEPHDLYPLICITRHDQVTEDDPAFGEAVGVEDEVTDLSMHLLDGPLRDFGIISGLAEPLARF